MSSHTHEPEQLVNDVLLGANPQRKKRKTKRIVPYIKSALSHHCIRDIYLKYTTSNIDSSVVESNSITKEPIRCLFINGVLLVPNLNDALFLSHHGSYGRFSLARREVRRRGVSCVSLPPPAINGLPSLFILGAEEAAFLHVVTRSIRVGVYFQSGFHPVPSMDLVNHLCHTHPHFLTLFKAYTWLRVRGFVPCQSLRYGGPLVVYPVSPLHGHSKYTLTHTQHTHTHAFSRVANTSLKMALTVCLDDDTDNMDTHSTHNTHNTLGGYRDEDCYGCVLCSLSPPTNTSNKGTTLSESVCKGGSVGGYPRWATTVASDDEDDILDHTLSYQPNKHENKSFNSMSTKDEHIGRLLSRFDTHDEDSGKMHKEILSKIFKESGVLSFSAPTQWRYLKDTQK